MGHIPEPELLTFSPLGNVTQKKQFTAGLHTGDPAFFNTGYTYNADSMLTSITNPKGNGAKFVYDETNPDYRSRGNLLQVRRKADMNAIDNDPNDIVVNIAYDALFNQIDTLSDAKGNTTSYTYDYELAANHPKYNTKGDLIFIDQPAVIAGIPTIEFAYNAFGQITQMIDPNGNVTLYDYFPATGYLQAIKRDPGGINAITQFTYDQWGNLNQITDPNNHTTNYDFNEVGWLIKEASPLGNTTRYTYDANGNVVKLERGLIVPLEGGSGGTPSGTTTTAVASSTTISGPTTLPSLPRTELWQTTEFTYDTLNNLKTVKDPLDRVTTYNYDNNENLESILDAEGNTTARVYDERDLLFTVTDANTPAGVTTYDYDANGNLKKITDANGNPTDYAFDLFDRMFTQTYADSSFSKNEYDKNSNLFRRTTPANKILEYDYDALDRLQTVQNLTTPALNKTFDYDLGSRLILADTANAQHDFTYDALNRVETNTQTLLPLTPLTLSYEYDKTGNRTKVTYPSGKIVDYTYDANDRMNLVKVNTATLVDYTYDNLERRKQKSFVSTALPVATYQYDPANQLKNITNKLVNDTAVSKYAYPVYDQVGNRKQLKRTLGINPADTIDYTYNDIYELIDVANAQTHSYDYDKVANREIADGVTYVPNNLNQYDSIGGTVYLYDANGNLANDGTNT